MSRSSWLTQCPDASSQLQAGAHMVFRLKCSSRTSQKAGTRTPVWHVGPPVSTSWAWLWGSYSTRPVSVSCSHQCDWRAELQQDVIWHFVHSLNWLDLIMPQTPWHTHLVNPLYGLKREIKFIPGKSPAIPRLSCVYLDLWYVINLNAWIFLTSIKFAHGELSKIPLIWLWRSLYPLLVCICFSLNKFQLCFLLPCPAV